MNDTLNLTEVDSKIFFNYFSEYISNDIDISSTSKALVFKYDDKSKKYIEYLLRELYDFNGISILFRGIDDKVTFSTSKSMEELYFLVKNKMDNIKYSVGDSLNFDGELKSIYNLFLETRAKKIPIYIGIKNSNNDKFYKLLSSNEIIADVFKKPGLVINDEIKNGYQMYYSVFNKSNVHNSELLFDTIKNNLNEVVYQANLQRGFTSYLNTIFLLIVDTLAITIGIYLLLH